MKKEEFQKEVGMGMIRQLSNLRKFMNAYSITIRDGGILSNNEFDELDDALNKALETIDKNLDKKRIMKKKYFVVEEDAGLYNIFSVEDFDDDGYLCEHNGEDGYHLDDFKEQVVYETDSFKDAVNWEEEHSKY